jgi:hypothetical protein
MAICFLFDYGFGVYVPLVRTPETHCLSCEQWMQKWRKESWPWGVGALVDIQSSVAILLHYPHMAEQEPDFLLVLYNFYVVLWKCNMCVYMWFNSVLLHRGPRKKCLSLPIGPVEGTLCSAERNICSSSIFQFSPRTSDWGKQSHELHKWLVWWPEFAETAEETKQRMLLRTLNFKAGSVCWNMV